MNNSNENQISEEALWIQEGRKEERKKENGLVKFVDRVKREIDGTDEKIVRENLLFIFFAFGVEILRGGGKQNNKNKNGKKNKGKR